MKSSSVVLGLGTEAVVTITSTSPALCAGLTAEMLVALTYVKIAAVPPNVTVMPLAVKPVPVIVTKVVPAVVPVFGETRVTVGPLVYV